MSCYSTNPSKVIAVNLNPVEDTCAIGETSDELKVEYFELKSRLDAALQLQPFLSEANATLIMSILLAYMNTHPKRSAMHI